MSMTEVELELRRLGGDGGLLNLLRRSNGVETTIACAGRVELGAALVALKVKDTSRIRICGGTPRSSASYGRDVGERTPRVPIAATMAWESKVLLAVVDALQGANPERTRTGLLRAISALGHRIQEVDLAERLFGILSDGISQDDAPCCRNVCRALAVGLQQSQTLREQSACCAKRIIVLLALSFPGQIIVPDQHSAAVGGHHEDENCMAAKAVEGARTPGVTAIQPEIREDALSCLCSILRDNDKAAEVVASARGIEPLFQLAMGEGQHSDADERPPHRQSLDGKRARTSLPGSRRQSAARRGISSCTTRPKPRPMTARTATLQTAPVHSTGGEKSAAAPIADGMRWPSMVGWGPTKRSARRTEEEVSDSDTKKERLSSVGLIEQIRPGDGDIYPMAEVEVRRSRPPPQARSLEASGGKRQGDLAVACLIACLQMRRPLASDGGSENTSGDVKRKDSSSCKSVSRDKGQEVAVARGATESASKIKSSQEYGEKNEIDTTGRTKTAAMTPRRKKRRSASQTATTKDKHVDPDKSIFVGDSTGRDTEGSRSKHDDTDSVHVEENGLEEIGKTAVYTELQRLGAVAKAPGMLNAPSSLHQELGVALLVHGLTRSSNEKEQVSTRQTSSPARTVKAKRAQLLNWLTVRSGCLRSLTWLLLHRRREIAQGAASILRAVASCPGTARWVISFVEQGCVPVLWMAAAALQTNVYGWTGRVGKEAKEVDSPTVTATVDTPGGGRGGLHTLPPAPCCSEHARCPCTSGTHTTEGRRAWTSDYERVAAVSVVGPNCQETAKFLLKVIAREVCTRHADRLVRAVNVSGNRELRSNLALGLVLLSAESASRHFDEARRSLVSRGSLNAVLGMLRSPTGRPEAVSFLQVVASLVHNPSSPVDIFSVAAEGIGSGGGGGADPEASSKTSARSEGDRNDTEIVVRDPLASFGRGLLDSRGGLTEAEGIKMACPPREVICRASPLLRNLLQKTPEGELPLLEGRYRAWEEIMANMGAGHTFSASSGSYLTPLLIDMFVLAARFDIKGQADGYARELYRRLHPLPLNTKRFLGPRVRQVATTCSTTEQTASSNVSSDIPTLGTVEENIAATFMGVKPGVHIIKRGSRAGITEVLGTALQCRHEWLCVSAFRRASAMMGSGGGEGLPPRPQELTALLAVLERFLSALFLFGDCAEAGGGAVNVLAGGGRRCACLP